MLRVIGYMALGIALTGFAPRHGFAQKPARDTSFHAMQMRGKVVMGVDQYTSKHVFEDLADGGRIELQRDLDDAEGAAIIRQHLKLIADAFAAGDFTAPALVHMKEVPGVEVLAAKRKAIRYVVRDLQRGAELRIRTTDRSALSAIHKFLAFQRAHHTTRN